MPWWDRESCALGPPIIFVVVQAHRHSEGADEHLASETARFLGKFPTYAGSDGVIATPRCGMVQHVSASKEDLGQIFVAICHHGGARCFLCHREVVDIFDRAESLFPEFEVDGGVELSKVRIEVVLEGWRGWWNALGGCILRCWRGGDGPTKLDLALVHEREVEHLLCDLLMESHWTVVRGDRRHEQLTWYIASNRALFLSVSSDVR